MNAAILLFTLTLGSNPAGLRPSDALHACADILVKLQEDGQWPYEGVYRVQRQIPIGYRVGGTAIGAMALAQAPGLDDARRGAIDSAVQFLCAAIEHPLMSIDDYDAGYDVRAWGYIYGLHALCDLKTRGLIAPAQREPALRAAAFYLDGLTRSEIPQVGGWNYARPAGRERVAPPSSFMTAAALQALFEAAGAGFEVDGEVVARALDFLESARGESGSFRYSGAVNRERNPAGEAVPAAAARMAVCEATLALAGRGDEVRLRASLDAFVENWNHLNDRRAKPGTHEGPYRIAPYYFMFGHRYAAQAVELLPEAERPRYRDSINTLLFSVRDQDGSWNDRVFPRSAAFGTAFAMMAILAPEATPPARWPRP